MQRLQEEERSFSSQKAIYEYKISELEKEKEAFEAQKKKMEEDQEILFILVAQEKQQWYQNFVQQEKEKLDRIEKERQEWLMNNEKEKKDWLENSELEKEVWIVNKERELQEEFKNQFQLMKEELGKKFSENLSKIREELNERTEFELDKFKEEYVGSVFTQEPGDYSLTDIIEKKTHEEKMRREREELEAEKREVNFDKIVRQLLEDNFNWRKQQTEEQLSLQESVTQKFFEVDKVLIEMRYSYEQKFIEIKNEINTNVIKFDYELKSSRTQLEEQIKGVVLQLGQEVLRLDRNQMELISRLEARFLELYTQNQNTEFALKKLESEYKNEIRQVGLSIEHLGYLFQNEKAERQLESLRITTLLENYNKTVQLISEKADLKNEQSMLRVSELLQDAKVMQSEVKLHIDQGTKEQQEIYRTLNWTVKDMEQKIKELPLLDEGRKLYLQHQEQEVENKIQQYEVLKKEIQVLKKDLEVAKQEVKLEKEREAAQQMVAEERMKALQKVEQAENKVARIQRRLDDTQFEARQTWRKVEEQQKEISHWYKKAHGRG